MRAYRKKNESEGMKQRNDKLSFSNNNLQFFHIFLSEWLLPPNFLSIITDNLKQKHNNKTRFKRD